MTPPASMELKGEKALLREIAEDDLPLLLAWRNSPHVHGFMFTNHLITPEEHRRWFDSLKDSPNRKFLVICDAATRAPAGLINWRTDEKSQSAEIGIYIGEKELRRKGLAEEAMELVITHLFRSEDMREVVAQVFAFNAGAIRFYEELGFETAPSLTWQYEKNGKPEDVLVMKKSNT